MLWSLGCGEKGYYPLGKLVVDPEGNLYGTTRFGGSGNACNKGSVWQIGCGTVFEVKAPTTIGGSWTGKVIYSFDPNGNDGFSPAPNLVWRDGAIYGVTESGGATGNGIVFQIVRSKGSWTENILHSFTGSDGWDPLGGLIVDSEGNLYGTTKRGGTSGRYGTVFELSPPSVAGGSWVLTTLYNFTGRGDGSAPSGGLWRDKLGAIWGTASQSGIANKPGANNGSVFKLRPPTAAGGSWTLAVVHDFGGSPDDGGTPCSELILVSGSFYGSTLTGGTSNNGTIFSILP